MPFTTQPKPASIEATVTSKGQITLPKELRIRLGIQKGSRIRFTLPPAGAIQLESVRFKIKELWVMADQGEKPKSVMSFAEMNAAKARRQSS